MPKQKSSSASAVERLVINTGPLVALAKAQALEIAGALPIEFLCPVEVRAELNAGAAKGHREVTPSWLNVQSLERPLDLVAKATLDIGEAAVIQLAHERKIQRVCIDERKARRAATAAGLQVVGTLGLLLRAKSQGLIPSMKPLIDRLRQGGDWFDEALVARVLHAAGEAEVAEDN